MRIEFDRGKNDANIAKHGVDMAKSSEFAFDLALTVSDRRRDYGEDRFISLGLIGQSLHVLVFTMRGQTVRVISLRLANRKEREFYDDQA